MTQHQADAVHQADRKSAQTATAFMAIGVLPLGGCPWAMPLGAGTLTVDADPRAAARTRELLDPSDQPRPTDRHGRRDGHLCRGGPVVLVDHPPPCLPSALVVVRGVVSGLEEYCAIAVLDPRRDPFARRPAPLDIDRALAASRDLRAGGER